MAQQLSLFEALSGKSMTTNYTFILCRHSLATTSKCARGGQDAEAIGIWGCDLRKSAQRGAMGGQIERCGNWLSAMPADLGAVTSATRLVRLFQRGTLDKEKSVSEVPVSSYCEFSGAVMGWMKCE